MAKKLTSPILLVGSTNDCPELEYASGFRAADPVIFLQKGRDKFLVVPKLEIGRAARAAWHVRVFTPQQLGIGESKRKHFSEWAARLLRHLNIKTVTVPPFFPYGVAKHLERIGVRITVAKTELFPERAVKSTDELSKIRESQQAAVIAMRTAVEMIASSEIDRKGYLRVKGKLLTSEKVRDTILKVLLKNNTFCRETIVAGGLQAADPHETGKGPLHGHEAIVIDIFPQHLVHGYWGDLTRTVVKGNPPRELKKMYSAVKAAQAVALERIKPRTKCTTVHQSAVEEFKRRGFNTTVVDEKGAGFIHSTGHGVGLAIHEVPSLAAVKGQLRTGNVVTVEPGLYYPDIGGVRIEDTVVVTSTGWRYLVPCEKKFEI